MKRDWSRVKGAAEVVFLAAIAVNFIWVFQMIVFNGYGSLKGWW